MAIDYQLSTGNFLLHDCCAPCGAYVLERLLAEGHEVVVFFYNPNIAPADEYEWRKREMKEYCAKKHVQFIDGDYNHDDWKLAVSGLEGEPERGKRCEGCFAYRLSHAAQKAKELGISKFGTTLTISPHKLSDMVNRAGWQVARAFDLDFYDVDWKKNDGYKNACELSDREGFHRQNYCGCEFSMRPVNTDN